MLKDYKSEQSILKTLKEVLFCKAAGSQSATLLKNKLYFKYFSIDLSTY